MTIPEAQRAIEARCFHPSGQWEPLAPSDLEMPIPPIFERQAELRGDKTAVRYRGEALTYRGLNEAANRTAHAILDLLGLPPDAAPGETPPTQVVVLLFERGLRIYPALLGTLKAGRTYAPLDPAYPPERLTYMLEDAGAQLIVTEGKHLALAHQLARQTHPRIPILDIEQVDGSAVANPRLAIPPDTLAMLLYTSGSTGKPKGVTQTHRQRLTNMHLRDRTHHYSAEDRLTNFASPSVAAFTGEDMPMLLKGGTLFPYDLQRDGIDGVARWLQDEQITMYHSPPSVLRRIMATFGESDHFPHLRLIRMGSEPLFKDVVEGYKRHFPDSCILTNLWGATEGSLDQPYYIDKNTVIEHATAPVGYSTPLREVLLVHNRGDGTLEAVPPGEAGEIALKMTRTGTNYWRRPDLDAARRRTAPDGDLIYLTGDVGRFLPDGALLHLGRKDFMLKIRGHLVEAAEVELALKQLPGVTDAVVVGKPNRTGEQRLIAYFAAAAEDAPSASEMRRHLARSLPAFMLPALYVRMDRLPLNANGKIDRLSLPEPSTERPLLDAPYAAPTTPVEERVARIWADALGLARVGIHDPFLELGGDSLLAAQVVAAVVRAFEVEIPLASLFETPTVAAMALEVSRCLGQKAGPEAVARLLAELETTHGE